MKQWLIGLVLGVSLATNAQPGKAYAAVDAKAESLSAPTPDSLGRTIAREFATPGERLRAIYCWITANIRYNTAIYKPWTARYRYDPDPLDSAMVWPSGEEMMARKVMRQGKAVCDGYSRLFKAICDHAGLEAVVIQGFGRGYRSDKFKTNHTWNAVKLDSAWYLLDLTWAAGYLNSADEYVARRNDAYYLTPPQHFIYEHHPEDLRWTLLASPPALSEFRRTPFRTKNYFRYGFASFFPGNGQIEAAVGDTLVFRLRLADAEKVKYTGPDPFVDTTTYAAWPHSSFGVPAHERGEELFYSVVVQPGVDWIHLLYKNDVVLHYRVRHKEMTAAGVKMP